MKRIKMILICAILACGAVAGASIGIMLYLAVKAVDDKIKGALKIKNILKWLPIKRKAK